MDNIFINVDNIWICAITFSIYVIRMYREIGFNPCFYIHTSSSKRDVSIKVVKASLNR